MRRILFSLLLTLVPALAAAQGPDAEGTPSCVACEITESQWRDRYSEDQWRKIEGGEIVTTDVTQEVDGEIESSVDAAGLIKYPPGHVWKVVTDFESRPQYVSDSEEVRVVRSDGNRVWTDEHLRFLFVDVRYRTINTLEPRRGAVTWKLDDSVEHDLAENSGSWQLRPLSEGEHTFVQYRARIDTGQSVPGFIEAMLLRGSLPELLRSLRGEVERRYAN